MCDAESTDIDGDVPEDTFVYRGCGSKGYLNKDKNGVQDRAFLKPGQNHRDGLSLGLTAIQSVRGFRKGNFGAIRIRVADIIRAGRELHLDITVKYDERDRTHALIRNMPCTDQAHEEADAHALAQRLALLAQVDSAEPIVAPPEHE